MAQALAQLLQRGERAALATVVRVHGSTPQRAGARLLMHGDGSLVGSVGGGAIEHDVLAALRVCLEGGDPQLLVRELGYDLGMCCGGRMEIFIEPLHSQARLVVCGAGHIAQALAPLARSIGFAVTVVDEREPLNDAARFPDVERVLDDPESFLKRSPLTDSDWVLITTHDHALDERLLELSLLQDARYVGMVGSRRKVVRLLERIRARRGELSLARLHAPVGLALNAQGPHEIAVSIVAELVALRRAARVPHMRAVDDERMHKVLGLTVGKP